MTEQRGKIRQLRRKGGGIQELIRRVGGTAPRSFYQDDMDRTKDGTPTGAYKVSQIIDTRQHLCPMWDIHKKQWSWGGTENELQQLIEKSGLKYEKGPKAGTFISKDKDISPAQRLKDFNDGFFKHPALYNKMYLKDDRASFDQDNPIHEILWLCQIGRTGVHDQSSGKRISKFNKDKVRLEAVAPSAEAKNRKDRIKTGVLANKNLAELEEHPRKMRMIAQALLLPTFNEESTNEEVFNAIYAEVIEGEQNNRKKYNGRTIMARFNEICSMPAQDVSIIANTYLALRKQVIVRRGDDYLLNGDPIKNVGNVYNLAKFFLDSKNQDKYVEVADSLGDEAY